MSTICGLKFTHDGAVAVIEGNQLLFCTEMEKIDNQKRYSKITKTAIVRDQLLANGISVGDLDAVAIDGWLTRPGISHSTLDVIGDDGAMYRFPVAGYMEAEDPLRASDGAFSSSSGELRLDGRDLKYRSYKHATNHIFASYCTSPFAAEMQPALILVWDGYMPARLYSYDPGECSLTAQGTVVDFAGIVYPAFASFVGPFREANDGGHKLSTRAAMGDRLLSLSGKAMAYAGLDEPSDEAISILEGVELPAPARMQDIFRWTRVAIDSLADLRLSDPSILASFQEFLARRLVRGLREKLAELALPRDRLCVSGGCALNIKWNSALRQSGLVRDVWIPPFPNDSGSAIGAACTEMIQRERCSALEWSVFSGPQLQLGKQPRFAPWRARQAGLPEVAELMHRGEPVVVLSERAELGPRALGHRSIIASATDPQMRDELNRIKVRESYRPVAPICLENYASEIFSPGGKDPYMLFEHKVRTAWRERIPAVVHADGSARLQTVGADNSVLYELLSSYHALSGIPVLCNTSANLPGRGFFPDVASAIEWGQIEHVWSDGILYRAP